MMDALSDLLRSVRLVGGLFLDAHFTAPWCVLANMSAEDCRPFLGASPRQLIAYHYVVEGALYLSLPGEAPVMVRAGEVVLLPRNDPHLLASAPGLPPVRAGTLVRHAPGGLARIDHGGGGPATRLVCGFLASADGENPLIETLPRALRLPLRDIPARDWVEASLRLASAELARGRPASSDMVSRLSELLLVEAVRRHAASGDATAPGWLRGLQDAQIGRALALIHRDHAAPWTADRLARAVALSRSAFIQRFRALVGMPPIRYVSLWRLRMAKLRLRETGNSVAQIADVVGYGSEEAFSRAFKREFGLSPAHWRDREAA